MYGAIDVFTLSVISPKGGAGLAQSICRRVAVSISQMDTSLLPVTAEMREGGSVGCGFNWYTACTWAGGGGYMHIII